ncbi:Gfo/Idh/MocA family oxidoreductase [bacterium]|jgi:predicted dehydrogenase|nr:Gfo/Idh/MocA family oxidoreductase [bacterium]MDB4507576.1 Gfo/Idh/MocA family oxidoreductase [bacterium]
MPGGQSNNSQTLAVDHFWHFSHYWRMNLDSESSLVPSRRSFLRTLGAGIGAAPMILPSRVFGANGRITMGAIGMGNRGRNDLKGFLKFADVQVLSVCDVVAKHAAEAKRLVDARHGNNDCSVTAEYRDILTRDDIDTVMIGTPDHWHAIISTEAMRAGKDVFCEKPETLTVQEGRAMADVVKRYGRVFSGGSQRVWGDYNWFHRMIKGGAIGDVEEVWVNVGGPSGLCDLPAVPVPEEVDWKRWLGPAPWRAYHPSLIRGGFRPFRDYSGGGMTDWGCHGFGGALFACGLQETGPTKISLRRDAPNGEGLTYTFENGIRIHHGGGWGGILSFKGTEGELPFRGDTRRRPAPPNVHIPNYQGGRGFQGDFIHCVRTRDTPFRSIERAHRTASHCHLGNIAYWLDRSLQWDPDKERILGDEEASRWLQRSMREPWSLNANTLASS